MSRRENTHTLACLGKLCKVVIKVEQLKVSTAKQSYFSKSGLSFSAVCHSVTDCFSLYSTTQKESEGGFQCALITVKHDFRSLSICPFRNRLSTVLFTRINKKSEEWRLSKLNRTWCKPSSNRRPDFTALKRTAVTSVAFPHDTSVQKTEAV